MKVGDLVHPWPDEGDVGLVVGHIKNEHYECFLVLSEGSIYTVPVSYCNRKKVLNEGR